MRHVTQCMLMRQFIDIGPVFSSHFIDIVQILVCSLAPLRTMLMPLINLVYRHYTGLAPWFFVVADDAYTIWRSKCLEYPFSTVLGALYDALV